MMLPAFERLSSPPRDDVVEGTDHALRHGPSIGLTIGGDEIVPELLKWRNRMVNHVIHRLPQLSARDR